MADPKIATNPRLMNPLEIGREQMIEAVGGGNENLYNRLVRDTGIYGLSAFINDVLDKHYPADVFGTDIGVLYETWTGEHGGDDIASGTKWVALLRAAVRHVGVRKEPK